MQRNTIAGLFLCLFLLLMVTPIVIALVDDTIDISVVLSTSGEEEEQGNEEKLTIEFLCTTPKEFQSSRIGSTLTNSLTYFYRKYTKPHLNIVSPPPDLYTR